MFLTVDLGNTSIKFGLFKDDVLIAFSCLDNIKENFKSLMLNFIFKAGVRQDQIDKAIFSCVVPKLYDIVYDDIVSIVGKNNIIDINPSTNYGIKLDVAHPEEVGDDLIVMCAYAYNLYHRELLVVSMGTCSVICHVTAQGAFKHCIIAPGFTKISETLWKNAAQLPQFNLQNINSYLADNTIDAMNVGIFNGYVGMMNSLIYGIKKELNTDLYVIGCGGQGKTVAPYIKFLNEYEPDFVTRGLNYIASRYYNE